MANDFLYLAKRFLRVDCLCEVLVVVVYVSEVRRIDGVTVIHADAEVVLGCRNGARIECCVIWVLGFMPPRISAIVEHRVIDALCDERAAFFGVMDDFADVVFRASFHVKDVVPDCFHDGIDL